MEPTLRKVKEGWAAYGDGWAVHATTEEEALAAFRKAEEKHREIAARPLPSDPQPA